MSLNKRTIKTHEQLKTLLDRARSAYPHQTVEKPDALPAVFVWTVEQGRTIKASISFVWVCKDEL